MTELDRPRLLIREVEGLTIEYKEHFTPRIAEDMVAFADPDFPDKNDTPDFNCGRRILYRFGLKYLRAAGE